jgi:hypothetical protein
MQVTDLVWTGMWCYSPGGTFSFTTTIFGLGGRTVTAEASLAKIISSWGDPRFARAAVFGATFAPGGPLGGMTQNFGTNGNPIRLLQNCSTVTFSLEVQRSWAEMNGKVYSH